MPGPVISTWDLTRSFKGRVAVDELTLEVAAGEVVALLGPNGAGKTTTVRLLNGVLAPDRGGCRVLGLDPVADGDDVRQRTGVLTEAAGLDDRLTAMENLLAAARIRGLSDGDGRRRGHELLDRFGMGDYADRRCQGFSTGQRKRVALARALLHDPEVLFLDEPTSGLDPEATRDVVELIATLARGRGRTVILCTHFLAEANRIADRMAVLQLGRLRAFGRPDELAAGLWQGLAVDLDLGAPADERAIGAMLSIRGVLSAEPTATGAMLRVEARDDVPGLVAAVVGLGLPVFGAAPRPATVEDVYFAIQGLT
jgi:ABC-2 type transport system ATP-binding protein